MVRKFLIQIDMVNMRRAISALVSNMEFSEYKAWSEILRNNEVNKHK